MANNIHDITESHFDLTDCIDFYKSTNTIFDKHYHIPINIYGKSLLYVINIKSIDDKIFLYLNEIILKTSTLIHVFESNINIQLLEKYIQMSHDYKLLSIPDGDILCIFDIVTIINNKTLKTNYSNAKIKFKNTNISTLSVNATITNNSLPELFGGSLPELFNGTPYKCILYSDRYIIVSKNESSNYKSVIIYDFIHKCTHVVNINKNINNSSIALSEHGKYLLFCDIEERNTNNNIEQYIWLVDLNNLKDTCDRHYKLLITTQNASVIHINTFAISNNGELVCVLVSSDNKNKLLLVDNNEREINTDEYELNNIGDPKYITMNIYDHSDMIKKNQNGSKLYIITIWNKQIHKVFIWTIVKFANFNDMIYGPKILTFCGSNIESVNTNGHQYIYKCATHLVIYDIDKHLPLMMVNSMLDTLKIPHTIVSMDNNNLEQMFLHLLNNHYEMSKNIKNISEPQIILLFDIITKIQNTKHLPDNYCDYMEYLIIKITLMSYQLNYSNIISKKNIKHLTSIFNKLKLTKMFFVKMIEFNFGIKLVEYL